MKKLIFLAIVLISIITPHFLDEKEVMSIPPVDRPADQTYLTYPEWFLVFSPDEYAYHLQEHPAYSFPYFGHLNQFWTSYEKMYEKTKEKGYPFNTGYHIMIMVIGVSTSIEYTVKSLYGNTIGRLASLTQTHGRTSEQRYGANVAQEYVDFIKHTPWYAFDFGSKFIGIYTKNSFFGDDFIRKSERKFALSCEYGLKYIYAKVLGFFTKMGYEAPSLSTKVQLSKEGSTHTINFNRYDTFKDMSLGFAQEGYQFQKIAGNDKNSSILISLIADSKTLQETQCILKTPILVDKTYQRCLLDVQISQLSKTLRNEKIHITDRFLPQKGEIKLEHIFDF